MRGLGAVLVVVPHPDDESIGCGGLLALLREQGSAVTVASFTDGEQSHPGSRRWPSGARADVRQAELAAALVELGVGRESIVAFHWPDGDLPDAGHDRFEPAVGAFVDLIEARSPQTVLAPWRRDPHRDHRAANAIARAAIARIALPIRLIEYLVWTPERGSDADAPREGEVRAVELDISTAVERKLRAVAAHRSQHGLVFDDDPGGFSLSPAMRARCAEPRETYLEALGAPTSARATPP